MGIMALSTAELMTRRGLPRPVMRPPAFWGAILGGDGSKRSLGDGGGVVMNSGLPGDPEYIIM